MWLCNHSRVDPRTHRYLHQLAEFLWSVGGEISKLKFRSSILQLTTRTQPIDANNDEFWDQLWSDYTATSQDIFVLIPATDIRGLRQESPNNLATLCYKNIEKIVFLSELPQLSHKDQQILLNCIRLLTRLIPYIYEDPDWRSFFWSTISQDDENEESISLAQNLLNALADLLFSPDFTISLVNSKSSGDEIKVIDSCEHIWQSGVGFAQNPPYNAQFDKNRLEILKLILTCFSETMYLNQREAHSNQNKWISYFTGPENKHALPLFTSLLNVICAYDPIGLGLPYNHLMFNDAREPLVEVSSQLLCILLEKGKWDSVKSKDKTTSSETLNSPAASTTEQSTANLTQSNSCSNFFVNYMSRIHRDEDFNFILTGFSRLLNNPLIQTYLPGSTKKVQLHQELFILFWRMCDVNKRFMYFVLKSSYVLDILVPILYHINHSRDDQSKLGLIHIGVFILLLLSGERNFGVRLNKPYQSRIPMDIAVFTGNHADLLIIVFYKLITTGHSRLQPLFECLLTIIVNISPYVKSLSMVSSMKLLHLLEAFSQPWFLLRNQNNHQLIFFLLEVFNNIIQYQFDGNSNLIYCLIRKRQLFFHLANLSTDQSVITKLAKANARKGSLATPEQRSPEPFSEKTSQVEEKEASNVETEAQTACSLAKIPNINDMTNAKHLNGLDERDSVSSQKFDEDDDDVPSLTLSDSASCNQRLESPTKSSPSKSPQPWTPTSEWVIGWKDKLPLQTIMRLLQVLVPQVEKICIEKSLTDESEIIKFLQNGTLVGLLPVPHPILIRKYQPNYGTSLWFRNYMWGVIYLRNNDPPIWYDTNVRLFEIRRY